MNGLHGSGNDQGRDLRSKERPVTDISQAASSLERQRRQRRVLKCLRALCLDVRAALQQHPRRALAALLAGQDEGGEAIQYEFFPSMSAPLPSSVFTSSSLPS